MLKEIFTNSGLSEEDKIGVGYSIVKDFAQKKMGPWLSTLSKISWVPLDVREEAGIEAIDTLLESGEFKDPSTVHYILYDFKTDEECPEKVRNYAHKKELEMCPTDKKSRRRKKFEQIIKRYF